MVSREEGRWDVSIKSNAVCLERISDGDKQLFEDLLAPEEARELAKLLTKFAEKVGQSGNSDKSDDEKTDNSDKPDETDKADESEKPEDSDKSSD